MDVDAGPTAQPAPEAERPPTLRPNAPAQSGVDRFDETITVARPLAWVGLAACAVLIVAVIAWAIFGSVRETTSAPGVALRGGSISTALSPVRGEIRSLEVIEGDNVSAGQVVATVVTADGTVVEITAPNDGIALDAVGRSGADVDVGQSVMAIQQVGQPLVVRAYATPADAQQMAEGMDAIVNFAAGGSIDGTIQHIDELVSDAADVASSVGHPATAEELLGEEDSVVGITIALEDVDESDLDQIPPAALATVTVIIGSERPLEHVL